MKVKILAVGRGEREVSGNLEAKMREALDDPTELRRAIPPILDIEHESIVSLFEDDGTFIRSYEF